MSSGGLPVCSPHMCVRCGAAVNERRLHGVRCHFRKGRHSRHAALNGLIKCSLDSAKIHSHNNGREPVFSIFK